MKTFGRHKSEMLQSWLAMSTEELALECKKYSIECPVEFNFKERFHALFNHIKAFEANIQSKFQTDYDDKMASKTR